MTGQLQNVFIDFSDTKDSEKQTSELSSFCFGALQRKFFIGNNSGKIMHCNMKNGEYLN